MHKYLKLLVFVLTSMALSRENVYAQDFSVSFNATNVEDKYAINSMPLVLLFKYLDFSYAGCLISFSVTYDENVVINEKTNPNIVAEVGLFDFASRKIEIIRIFDDINDKYIKNKLLQNNLGCTPEKSFKITGAHPALACHMLVFG